MSSLAVEPNIRNQAGTLMHETNTPINPLTMPLRIHVLSVNIVTA